MIENTLKYQNMEIVKTKGSFNIIEIENILKIPTYSEVDSLVANKYRIRLLGPFSFADKNGTEIAPNGRKAVALLALLASAPGGRRGRKWLQDRLWSDRADAQGAASLRQTLYEVRIRLGQHKGVLEADPNTISMDMSKITIDIHELSDIENLPFSYRGEIPQFLEGLDVADEEFEGWLREQRNYWNSFFSNVNGQRANGTSFTEQPTGVSVENIHGSPESSNSDMPDSNRRSDASEDL